MPLHLDGQTILITGSPRSEDMPRFSQLLYIAQNKKQYRDIYLDFSRTEAIFESFMVPVIALCRKYRGDGVDFDIDLPTIDSLKSLFHNSNWAHLLDPNRHEPTTFAGAQHFPAHTYRSNEEQQRVVDQILEVVLGSLRLERRQLKALEWCINEIDLPQDFRTKSCLRGGLLGRGLDAQVAVYG